MDVSFAGLSPAIFGLIAAAIGWAAAKHERRKLDRYLAEKRRRAAEATPAE